MSGKNYLMEIFDTIANEFSGKEFTKEDLMNKFGESIYNSEKEIDEEVWTGTNKFSIIRVEEYPELSEEESKMLLEIMDLYSGFSASPSQFIKDAVQAGDRARAGLPELDPFTQEGPSQFIKDFKGINDTGRRVRVCNRKNISQWYMSLFPTEEEHNKNALKYFESLKHLRMMSRITRKVWTKFYTNEEYCNKIMEKDIDTYKKYREAEINYLRGLNDRPIDTWPVGLKGNENIINYYNLNIPISVAAEGQRRLTSSWW